jgi:hypothetical protein
MNSSVNRRVFLKNIAAVGGMTVVSVTLPVLAEPKTQSNADSPTDQHTGYHETPHIRAYYRTLQE